MSREDWLLDRAFNLFGLSIGCVLMGFQTPAVAAAVGMFLISLYVTLRY